MLQSQYEQFREITFDDSYGTARRLQDFLLNQHKGAKYLFDASQLLGGFTYMTK